MGNVCHSCGRSVHSVTLREPYYRPHGYKEQWTHHHPSERNAQASPKLQMEHILHSASGQKINILIVWNNAPYSSLLASSAFWSQARWVSTSISFPHGKLLSGFLHPGAWPADRAVWKPCHKWTGHQDILYLILHNPNPFSPSCPLLWRAMAISFRWW